MKTMKIKEVLSTQYEHAVSKGWERDFCTDYFYEEPEVKFINQGKEKYFDKILIVSVPKLLGFYIYETDDGFSTEDWHSKNANEWDCEVEVFEVEPITSYEKLIK